MTQSPAGWHPAPGRPGQLRYWDGSQWTDHYSTAAPPPDGSSESHRPEGAASPPSTSSTIDQWIQRWPWLRNPLVLLGAGLVALILLGLIVSLALGPSSIDAAKVEHEIVSGVEEQSGIAVTVDCPDGVDIEVGKTFHCVVEKVGSGGRALADVTIENEDGDVTWQVN